MTEIISSILYYNAYSDNDIKPGMKRLNLGTKFNISYLPFGITHIIVTILTKYQSYMVNYLPHSIISLEYYSTKYLNTNKLPASILILNLPAVHLNNLPPFLKANMIMQPELSQYQHDSELNNLPLNIKYCWISIILYKNINLHFQGNLYKNITHLGLFNGLDTILSNLHKLSNLKILYLNYFHHFIDNINTIANCTKLEHIFINYGLYYRHNFELNDFIKIKQLNNSKSLKQITLLLDEYEEYSDDNINFNKISETLLYCKIKKMKYKSIYDHFIDEISI